MQWKRDHTVRLLLERGASIEVKDTHEHAALHVAANKGYWTAVRLLLNWSASSEDWYAYKTRECLKNS